MNPHDKAWQEIWKLLGGLRNEVAETTRLIRELKQQRSPQSKPKPETSGNVVELFAAKRD